jgi:hypothetical protein|tara:strand:+ start:593 stop:826 length:234 start_codon:yes stop_codon:yes gene_type:complete
MDWSNRFSLGGFIVSYSTLHQMWEVITEKDGIEVSYRWFGTKAKAEAFAMKKLVTAVDHNTKAVEQMVSLMRTNGGR